MPRNFSENKKKAKPSTPLVRSPTTLLYELFKEEKTDNNLKLHQLFNEQVDTEKLERTGKLYIKKVKQTSVQPKKPRVSPGDKIPIKKFNLLPDLSKKLPTSVRRRMTSLNPPTKNDKLNIANTRRALSGWGVG
jgi:hypothetical protein